jgi:D-3-phosphoglycerate dehydrogenase
MLMLVNSESERLRILCPEPSNFSSAGLAAAARIGELVAEPLSQELFCRSAGEFEVLLVRLQTRVPAEVIESSGRLRAIVSPTTGLDHIDLVSARQNHVEVVSLQGETAFLTGITSTAEHTWALLLALVRRLPAATIAVANGRWNQAEFRGRELKGKRIGIAGYGRLGRMVARYAQAFGMQILVYDPYVEAVEPGIIRVERFHDLLSRSDILTLHVPLNEQTHGMLGPQEIALLPEGAVLVNTSRGALVDESALLEALQSGKISAAGLDVLVGERDLTPSHPLVRYAGAHGNLLLTPHIGGACEEAIESADLFVLEKLRTALKEIQ